MGIFDSKRKEFKRVLPSGVPVTLRVFIGEHQSLITKNDEQKRRGGIDKMLRDCIVKLGNIENPPRALIDKMLSNDRAYCLFECRQESNGLNPTFTFDYEFPVDGEGKRRKKRFVVGFNNEDFPRKPYAWVWDKMVAKYRKENELNPNDQLSYNEKAEVMQMEFIEMADEFQGDYEKMLETHKTREIVLPDCGVKVRWRLLDSAKDASYNKRVKVTNLSSHDQLLIHDPRYIDPDLPAPEEGDTLPLLPVGKLSIPDIEALRRDIMTTQGFIETSVVIDYNGDKSSETQVNLISVAAFFFPSLAT